MASPRFTIHVFLDNWRDYSSEFSLITHYVEDAQAPNKIANVVACGSEQECLRFIAEHEPQRLRLVS